jgi:hypothetical protein
MKPYFAESPEERIREIAVLVKDLAEFSEDVAGWAVREWRLTRDRRPTSAALRQICMVRREALVREAKRREPELPELPLVIDDAERERRREFMATVLRGWANG